MKSARYMLCLLLLALALSACGPSAEQQATMTATALTATAAAWTPTPSSTPTATNTPTPSATPTRTATATRPPTQTATFTATPDPNRYFAPDGSYSLVPPEGWEEVEIGLDYPALAAPSSLVIPPNLTFTRDDYEFPMAFYSALVQDDLIPNLSGYTLVSEEFLVTSTDADLFRWEFTELEDGVAYRNVFYFFESGESAKLVVWYMRLDSQDSDLDALVDAAMDTLQFTP